MSTTRKSEVEREKRKRVPFSAHRSKLRVDDEVPGYHLHWFNDQDGRIDRALDAGYSFVDPKEVPRLGQGQLHQENTDLGSKVSKVVSRGKDVIRAYLMKLPLDLYEEDQRAKELVNSQVDDAIRAGTPGGNRVDNQYVPKGHKQVI